MTAPGTCRLLLSNVLGDETLLHGTLPPVVKAPPLLRLLTARALREVMREFE
jgi:hypothetical protein